jgi:hypothetical protein
MIYIGFHKVVITNREPAPGTNLTAFTGRAVYRTLSKPLLGFL